jgi:hypothetical protein
MGCCLFATILAGAPRLALVFWWIFQPVRLNATFPNFIWRLLGILFIPWTTLMYVIVFPSGINGFDWVWLGLAVAIDIGSYGGGYRARSQRSS